MQIQTGGFNFTGLERVIWGQPAITALTEEAIDRHAHRVLIVTSPTLRRVSPVPDNLAKALGDRCFSVYDGLLPHTPIEAVLNLHHTVLQNEIDLIITFGGGTPIDTAKVVIAMIAADVDDPLMVAGRENLWDAPSLRQIACPTTLSGAEFSDLAGLTDPLTKIKHGVTGYGIGPATVVLDPIIALKTPIRLWVSTGIRAVDHAIEAVCSIGSTPYTDALAFEALSQLPDALRHSIADPDNPAPRLNAQLAVWMASAGLDRTPYGASHGIGHQLGAIAKIPHGVCSCLMLPTVLEWNFEHCSDQQRLIAKKMNADTAADGVRALINDLGLPTRLSDLNIDREILGEIAQKSLSNRWVKTNPRPIQSAEQVLEILEAAY